MKKFYFYAFICLCLLGTNSSKALNVENLLNNIQAIKLDDASGRELAAIAFPGFSAIFSYVLFDNQLLSFLSLLFSDFLFYNVASHFSRSELAMLFLSGIINHRLIQCDKTLLFSFFYVISTCLLVKYYEEDTISLNRINPLPKLRSLRHRVKASANILFSRMSFLACSPVAQKNPNIKFGYFDFATNTLTLDHNNGNILCDMESKQRSLIETLSLHNITNFKKIADTATSQCTKISMKNCDLLEKYWDNLFEFAPNCKALSLYATPLPEKLPAQLTHLSIASDTTLEKGRLNNILEATTELTHLEIINCRQRDKASLELTVELPHLKTFNLSALSTSQPFLSPKELNALFDKTPNLKTLIIRGYKDLNALALEKLTQLQQIDISFSPISLNELDAWATQLEQKGKGDIQVQINAAHNLPASLHKTYQSAASIKQDIAHYKAQQIYIPLQERIKGLAYRSLFNKKTLIGAGIGSVVLYNYYKSKTRSQLKTQSLEQLISAQTRPISMPTKIYSTI